MVKVKRSKREKLRLLRDAKSRVYFMDMSYIKIYTPIIREHTLFSGAYKKFIKVDQISVYIETINKLQKAEVLTTI